MGALGRFFLAYEIHSNTNKKVNSFLYIYRTGSERISLEEMLEQPIPSK